MQSSRVLELDVAASVFFVVAAGLVFVPAVPWLELYQEQMVSGEEMVLLVEELGGLKARPALVGGILALLAAVLLHLRRPIWSFWIAVTAFFSGLMTYASLHSTLTQQYAPERKQSLEPGWGISSFLLWMAVGVFLFFVHRWGPRVWTQLKHGVAPVEAEGQDPDPAEPLARATWAVALVLLVLMVLFVASADPSDKVWKKMMR